MALEAEFFPRITVVLNGEPVATPARNLAELLMEARYGGARVATALNGEFVPEPRRGDTALREGDRVEILSPRQGG